MRCPRCKGENAENTIICAGCGLKLQTVCPRCQSLNKIGQSSCANCNLMLIRFCPQCKTPNFPNAYNCRKCNFQLRKPKEVSPPQKPDIPATKPIVQEKQPEIIEQVVTPVILPQNLPEPATPPEQPKQVELPNLDKFSKKVSKELSRNEAHDYIIKILKTSKQGLILGLSAMDGGGKSTLISSVPQSLKDEKIIWLIGNCYPDSQLVPYSFFRDMFKTLFNFPLFVPNIEESSVILKKIIETNLDIKEPSVNEILERIIFNDFRKCSEDIFENREQIHNAIFQIFNSLNQKSNIAFIVEDFEYIDSASFECIKSLLSKGFISKKNFIFINHRPDINLNDEFPMESLKNKIFSISLKPMLYEELNASLLGMFNGQDILPPKMKNRIFEISKNVPLYMEQVLWYLFQTGAVTSQENFFSFNPKAENVEIPAGLEELLMARFSLIEKVSSDSIRLIMSACMLGVKFVPYFVQLMTQMEEQQFNQVAQMLVNNGIFAMADQFNIRFKHSYIWRVVYEKSFTEEQIEKGAKIVLDVYAKYPGSISNSILVRHAEEANLKKEAFLFYDLSAKESVCLGDPATFTEYQSRLLELLPEADISEEQKEYMKYNIEEQLGRANYQFNPSKAMEYLSNSILYAEKQNNIVKTIDLTGYLARSCELVGNFSGTVECCDKALSYIDKNKYSLETVLLNYYKLESVFNLGRLEETIVNTTNEVLPQLNKHISKNKTIAGLTVADLKNIEFEVELTLAKAYVFQGRKKAFELTESLILKAQKENLIEYEVQALLIQALFTVIQGNIKKCNSIIETVNEKISAVGSPEKLKLYWYFITILASFTDGNFEQTKELCYTGLRLAVILNEYNILTLIKLILGKCQEELNQHQISLMLYNEVVNYCSENKMATGALFSWYLAANVEFNAGNTERAMEIAERAMEVSQKPNISNKLAEILLSKLVAKIRTSKDDFEGAQINIEHAISIAEENNLFMCLSSLYVTFAQIYGQSTSVTPDNSANNANIANRLYKKALSFAEQTENDYIISFVEKEISEFLVFCKQSGIKVENIN